MDHEVAVIGGGILGVGAAQACAAAGYSCVVVEQSDWAAGTSGRSSKLIHGGLRYLETGQLSLVRESLGERAILLDLGMSRDAITAAALTRHRRIGGGAREGAAAGWSIGPYSSAAVPRPRSSACRYTTSALTRSCAATPSDL